MSSCGLVTIKQELVEVESETVLFLVKRKVGESIEYRYKLFNSEEDEKDDDWSTYETMTNPSLIQEFEKVIEEKAAESEQGRRWKELEEKREHLRSQKHILEQEWEEKKRKLDEEMAELEQEEKRLKTSGSVSGTQPQPPVAVAVKPKLAQRNDVKRPMPAPKPKTKAKAIKRPPNAPKPPIGVFFLFSQDERPKLQKERPELNLVEIARELGKLWHRTSPETKEHYNLLAMEDKKRYMREMVEYQKTSAPSEIQAQDTSPSTS